MKVLSISLKRFLLLLTTIFLVATSANAIELINEPFDSNINGWNVSSSSKVYWTSDYGGSMFIDKGDDAKRTYGFGSSYANASLQVSVEWCATNAWENNNDYLEVKINGTKYKDYDGGGCQTFNFTTQADGNGDFEIKFKAKSSSNNEDAWIKGFTVTGPCHGCDCSLDDNSQNSSSPGVTIPGLHGATGDVTKCISGISAQYEGTPNKEDYYYFIVQTSGTLTITTSSPNNHAYHLKIGSSPGGSEYYSDTTAINHNVGTITLNAGDGVYLYLKETGSNLDEYQVELDFTAASSASADLRLTEYSLPTPNPATIGENITFHLRVNNLGPDTAEGNIVLSATYNQAVTIVSASQVGGGGDFTCSSSGSTITCIKTNNMLKNAPNKDFTFIVQAVNTGTLIQTATVRSLSTSDPITNNNTLSSSVQIISAPTLADAINDNFTIASGLTLSANVLTNDLGDGISVISNTQPSQGSVTIQPDGTLTYTAPTVSGSTSVTFSYTIRDQYGNEDTATVTITITIGTEYVNDGSLGFIQLNPQSTQNVIGNYIMTGNTVLCLTDKRSGYPDDTYVCQDSTNIGSYDSTSNNYVAKYIDIDDDPTTWNSSSANITLPDSYEQHGGNGILWAGLVWQGRFAWNPYVQELRYYTEGSPAPIEHRTGDGTNVNGVNIDTDAHVNLIRLKIDTGTYQQVQAYKVYSKTAYSGVTYSAVADITSLLRNANLAKGDHTFTIANLPTSEGRENSPGIYGGWSIVVIYAEDILVGKPRNITIYGGMLEMSNSETTVEISGFKLPSAGNTVTAQLSLFSGEGEYDYTTDGVDIGLTSNGPWTAIPETGNNTNVFDAKLSNVDRDHIDGKFNDLQNNNTGIDVDHFDISNIVSGYSRDTTSFWLHMWAREYVVPGMLAFSTELYQPSMCYDYTLEVGGYVIPSENNIIDTNIGAYTNDPLVTRVSIQSREGDFDFYDVNMTYVIADTNQTQYTPGTTAIAENDQFAYVDASGQTIDETASGFLIYLGDGASGSGGGVIKAYEKRFIKWENTINNDVNTPFSLVVQYTVDYGSGSVPIAKILTQDDICRNGGGYFIASDIFNVASANADLTTGQPYNLYTQVVNKPFNVNVFSHDINHINDDHRLIDADTAVEVEIYNADWFPRDVNLSCLTPDSNISAPTFVDFNNQSSSALNNLSIDYAVSNAGFRVWYLHRLDGSLVSHHCTDRTDQACFKTVWETELQADATPDRNCTTACNAASGCYSCMKQYYGQPVCSKDNFAIRPEAFVVELRDNQQSTQATATPITNIAHSVTQNQANVVAGYLYRFDINATNYLDDSATRGYYRTFDSQSTAYTSKMQLQNKTALINAGNCNDYNDKPVEFTIYEGTNVNYFQNISEQGQIEQVGLYDFNITDSNWTVVDWDPAKMTHHTAPGFDQTITDCVTNSGVVTNDATAQVGCEIRNTHIHPNGTVYQLLSVNFYPYQFNTGLNFSAALTPVDMVYMNTLHPSKIVPAVYQNIPDQNMSYNIQGTFSATGYDGNETLSNFVNGCFARDVNMILRHAYVSPLPDTATENIGFAYDLVDMNLTNPTTIVLPRKRVDSNLTAYGTNNTYLNLPVLQDGNISFAKDMQGTVFMDLGFNFDRAIDQPLNPRLIHVSDFNLTLANNPAGLSVNTVTNYIVATNSRVDQNISFAYARSKPGKYFYDDITNNSVVTPISVEVYCDLGYKTCADRGIDVVNGQTNDPRWWKVVAHDNIGRQDGRIALQVDNGSATVSPLVLISNSNGQDSTVTVGYTGANRPVTVNITHVLPPAANFTDLWLLYNEFSATTAPAPFYRVRFIDNAVWSGVGKTGNVVGTGAASKKTQRMDW